MKLRQGVPVAMVLGCLTPALLHAQATYSSPSSGAPEKNAVGGRMSNDLLLVKEGQLGIALRHGGLIQGSEEVSVGGRKLQPGQDYTIDDEAGVVYLLIPSNPGQSVSVSYRYDPGKPQTTGVASGNSLVPFRMDFGNGNSLGFTLGMGLADRTQDGSVLTSNIFGWGNAFHLGSSNLNGLMLVGDRTQQQALSNFEYQGKTVAPDQGKSHLILQSLGGNWGKGSFKLDYQDVSKNFTGFSAVTANGYDSSLANQLSKEKGLKRMSFSTDKLQFGSFGFSNSYKTVGDEKGGITWQNYSLTAGGLSMNYSSQNVGQHFDRFTDIAEDNRQQLAKEAGLRRQALDATWKFGTSSLSFTNSSILDLASQGIHKEDFKFQTSKFTVDMGSQSIEKEFNRFSSLNDPEAAQWGKESGLNRHWLAFDAAAVSAKEPFKFASYKIDSPTGSMDDEDLMANSKYWSFEHIKRQVDSGFTALPSLTQQEINANIGAITNMYVKGGIAVTPDMQGNYLRSPGLDRDFTRMTFTPGPKWSLGFETLKMTGQHDSAMVNNFTLTGDKLSVTYRRENFGPQFTELSSLMPFEQRQLGLLPGLNRTDLNVNAEFRRGAKLALNQTNAGVAAGDMRRQTIAYSDKTMQLNVNSRRVGPNFTAVSQLVDPEAGLLAQMLGFHETDAQFKWQALPNLHIEASSLTGLNDTLTQKQNKSNVLVQFGPNKATQMEFQHSSTDSNNPFDALLANILQRFSLVENLGKAGTLKYQQLEQTYDASPTSQPDSKQTDLSYETKLNDTTSLKSERVSTSYDNGTSQDVQSNTINTELSKKAGLSFTDISINNPGNTPDERKHNVGFWVSLWNGVRLNVGMNDDLNDGAGTTTTQHTMSLTPGTVGDWQIGSANYGANTWLKNDRTQAQSNISINTVKPFKIGPFRDMTLKMGQDTAADNGAWLKENKTFSLAGKVGQNIFGYTYFGQMNNLQQLGADRTFTFATDQSEKSPLRANLLYKFRTLPNDQRIAIRNFSITARPWKGLELTNEMLTNPEIPRGDVLLGSLPQPTRVNKWKLDYLRDPSFKVSGSWEEQRNDDTNGLSRLGGLTFTMFEKTGSPVSLFVGVEQAGGNVPDHTTDRWSLRWDQRPGPNQSLSLFVGNITYGGTISPSEKRHNLSVDFQYQIKF